MKLDKQPNNFVHDAFPTIRRK